MKLFKTHLFVFFNLLIAGINIFFIKPDVIQSILKNYFMRIFVILCSFLVLSRLVDAKSFAHHLAMVFVLFYYNMMISDLCNILISFFYC